MMRWYGGYIIFGIGYVAGLATAVAIILSWMWSW